VFIDETWASTNMAPRYGRGPRGQKVLGAAPFGHWKTTTFLAWIKQALAPTLKPGDVMVMDNLSAHKVAGVRQAIEAKDAKVAYLPPYSPDLNPIEHFFAKLKHLLRKTKARTVDAL
jgi:transposase